MPSPPPPSDILLPPTPEESLTHLHWLWSNKSKFNDAFNKSQSTTTDELQQQQMELFGKSLDIRDGEEEEEDSEDEDYFPDEEVEDILGFENNTAIQRYLIERNCIRYS